MKIEDFILSSVIYHGSAMMLKDTLFKVGLYDPLFRSAEDYELFIRIIKNEYKMKIVRDVL